MNSLQIGGGASPFGDVFFGFGEGLVKNKKDVCFSWASSCVVVCVVCVVCVLFEICEIIQIRRIRNIININIIKKDNISFIKLMIFVFLYLL